MDPSSLRRLEGTPLAITAYRSQAPGFDPRSGEGARRLGGRYNPPHSFPVLYLCTSRPCVVAELARQAERQGLAITDLLPRELWKVTAQLDRVLDLTGDEVLATLGVSTAHLTAGGRSMTRQIGEAAHERGFQAILSPSATGVDQVLAVFPENVGIGAIEVELVGPWDIPGDLP